jgi:hypothetical protein
MKTLAMVVMLALVALLPAVATTQEDRETFVMCDPFSRPDQDREIFAMCDPFSRPDQDREIFAMCDPFSRPDQDREIRTASIPFPGLMGAPRKAKLGEEAKTP